MDRHFRLQERDILFAPDFAKIAQAQARSLAGVHRRRTLKIGQRESAFTVTAVCGPEQREQRRVLADGQQLPVTERPAKRSKISAKDSDFGYELVSVGHNKLFSSANSAWETPPAAR